MDFPNCWFFAHTRHGSLVDEQLGNLQLPPTPKSWANLKKNKLHRVIQGKEFKLHRVIQGMLILQNQQTFTIVTRCSGCRVQDWVLVWASACHLATPKEYTRRQLKSLTANQWLSSELLRQSSGELGLDRRTTWTSTNTRCFLVCNSCCWPQQACLRKRCYHCWLSSRVKNGFYALQILNHDNPLYVKWNFQWNWQEVVTN